MKLKSLIIQQRLNKRQFIQGQITNNSYKVRSLTIHTRSNLWKFIPGQITDSSNKVKLLTFLPRSNQWQISQGQISNNLYEVKLLTILPKSNRRWVKDTGLSVALLISVVRIPLTNSIVSFTIPWTWKQTQIAVIYHIATYEDEKILISSLWIHEYTYSLPSSMFY